MLLKTDAKGRLDLEYSTRWGDDHLMFDIWADGHALQRVYYHGSEETRKIPNPLVVRLQKGQTLSGRLVDEAGEPAKGAAVYLWSHNYKQKDPNELLYNLLATSGTDGRWETTSAPEVTGELLGFMYRHPDYVSAFQYQKAPPIADLVAGTAVTVLKKGAEFSGRVLDMDGKPVEGAIVLFTDRSVLFLADTLHTWTDALGRFRFAGAPTGKATLLVRAPGLAAKIIERNIEAGDGPLEIRLAKGRVFRGRVLDSAGRPINKAHVFTSRLKGFAPLGEGIDTDADGRFRWDGAPEESMQIDIARPGYIGSDIFNRSTLADGEEHVYRMSRCLMIEGRLVDAKTNEAVEDFEFEIRKGDRTGSVTTMQQEPGVSLGKKGAFSMALDAESAASFRIRVRSPGYEEFVSRAIPSDRAKARVEIKLKTDPNPGPSGFVLGPDGKPRAGARVIMVRRKDSQQLHADPEEIPRQRFVTAGPDGRYQLPTTDAPYALAVVDEAGYALYDSDAAKGLTDIRLEAWSRVEGTLPDGPLRDRESVQWSRDFRPSVAMPKAPLVDAAGKKVHGFVVTTPPLKAEINFGFAKVDDQGRFVIERLPANPLTVKFCRSLAVLRKQSISPRPGETVQIHWEADPRVEP